VQSVWLPLAAPGTDVTAQRVQQAPYGLPEPRFATGASRTTGRLIWSEFAGAMVRLASPWLEGAAAMGPAPHEQRSRRTTRFRLRSRMTMGVGAGAVALAIIAAGCSSSSTTPTSTSGAKVKGGTAVWALPPSSTPNYIFPFESSAYISVINSSNFAQLMYRPLYWFGTGAQPTVNTSLSLASLPTWSGNTATIKLKHYVWSNGSTLTSADVMFWVNMLKGVGATDWGAYTGFPDAFVSSIKVVSPTEIQMTTNKTYSHTWFLYNDLSQITPMPAAWDKTSSGASSCATVVKDCAAVYNYLNNQAKNLPGYASSPLWGVVDGPWKLSAFNADGHITMVPNKSYSGPVKPSLSKFEEVPFTTDAAEYNVLRSSAAGGQKVDVGYLPEQDAPAKPAGQTTGANPLAGYVLNPLYVWGINYFVMNFQSSTGNGPVIQQLYFRQAIQDLMNQAAVIKGPLRGYGTLTVGPVGSTPATSYLSPQLKSGNPFPYNPTQAKTLLTSHGWKVVPNGVTTCSNASLCGKGIGSGHKLVFSLPYASGTQWIEQEMEQLQSNASLVGIKINLAPKPFNQVTALAAGNCKVAKIPCDWDMANWGGGWSFAPDYAPTGETLFKSGAIANSGGYSSTVNDNYIDKTLTTSDLQDMYTWQNYLSKQLPVEWQPNGAYQLTEVVNNLHGVIPQNPTLAINPENWYFVK
jgi:peptide/nickel transport system substrate-binding protein